MYNPFEQVDRDYVVLQNDEAQYSLWPAAIAIPTGWETVFGPSPKAVCQEYIEGVWIDMRPRSLQHHFNKETV